MRLPIAVAVALWAMAALAQPVPVGASGETDATTGRNLLLVGAAIWVHPTASASSLLLVSDPTSGVLAYSLDGGQVQLNSLGGQIAGLDVRENVLGSAGLVAAASPAGLALYRVNPDGGAPLQQLPTLAVAGVANPSDVALYRSPTDGRLHAFVTSGTSAVQQVALTVTAGGTLTATSARDTLVLPAGSSAQHLVADDAQRFLFVADQNGNLWRIGAEPDAGTGFTRVPAVDGGSWGPLTAMALYAAPGPSGYLLLASQDVGDVIVLERAAPQHTFRGSFVVVADGGIDDVAGSRALAVTNRTLSTTFPAGLLALHDLSNLGGGGENFKLVAWPSVALAFSPALVVNSAQESPGDGGTDGGTSGGPDGGPIVIAPPPGPPPVLGPDGDDDGASCNCAAGGPSGAVLLGLALLALASRRRR